MVRLSIPPHLSAGRRGKGAGKAGGRRQHRESARQAATCGTRPCFASPPPGLHRVALTDEVARGRGLAGVCMGARGWRKTATRWSSHARGRRGRRQHAAVARRHAPTWPITTRLRWPFSLPILSADRALEQELDTLPGRRVVPAHSWPAPAFRPFRGHHGRTRCHTARRRPRRCRRATVRGAGSGWGRGRGRGAGSRGTLRGGAATGKPPGGGGAAARAAAPSCHRACSKLGERRSTGRHAGGREWRHFCG